MKFKMLVAAFVLVITITAGTLPAVAAKPLPQALPQATAQADASASLASASGIATWLLEKAGGEAAKQGFGFLLSQVGLSSLFPSESDQQFAEIKRQLQQIQEQLAGLQTSVDALVVDVAENNLNTKIGEIQAKWAQVIDLYQFTFVPLANAGEAYRKALDTGIGIAAARTKLTERRNAYITKYEGFPYGTIANDIHNYLVPGARSILAAKGRLMLLQSGGRYLTAADSRVLRELYDNLAAQASLAAWLKMERYLPAFDFTKDPVPPLEDEDFELFNKARQNFLDNSVGEFVNLPAQIPNGVVVDAGAGTRRVVGDAPMWMPGSTNAALRFQPDVKGPGTVYDAEKELNDTNRTGFTDWQTPSQQQVTNLLTGNDPVKPVNDFLVSLNPDNDVWKAIKGQPDWAFIWSDTQTAQKISCYPSSGYVYNLSVPTNMALATANAQWAPRPKMVSPGGKYQSPKPVCDKYVADTWAGPNTTGAFLATRSAGKPAIDYMAQGVGPRINARANLREADLSGFVLIEVNMSNADLTGANLAGANLTGANLSSAKLDRVRSGRILGQPDKLPQGWAVINGYLVGPGADLRNAHFGDADLSDVDLRGVMSGGTSCACVFPEGWRIGGGYLLGPRVELPDADLSDVNIDGVDLNGANLAGADLRGASLNDANLREADLTGADLRNGSFQGASFVDAILTDVKGRGADLTDAILTGATMTTADFFTATFTGVSSGGIQLTGFPPQLPAGWRLASGYLIGPGADLSDMRGAGADFTAVDLSYADLSGANLRNAVFRNANLVGVALTGANIDGTDFSTNDDNKFAGMVSGNVRGTPDTLPASGRFRIVEGYFVGPSANLEGASFSSKAKLGVSLSNTNFTGANLRNVDLSGAALNTANFEGADLTGANVQNANFTNAVLRGVQSNWMLGKPFAVPAGWRFINQAFIGLQAKITGGMFLTGQDLTGMDLRGMEFNDTGLSNANLTNVNLEGATFGRYASLGNVKWSNTRCPNGVVQSTPCGLERGTQSPTIELFRAGNGFQILVSPKLAAQWKLNVEVKGPNGGFYPLQVLTTAGATNTAQVNVTFNTWVRAVALPQNGYLAATSEVAIR